MRHPQEYQRMAVSERDLWWYRALHQLVADTIQRLKPQTDIRILDVGCGTGGLMLFLQAHGYRDVRGFDLSECAVSLCRSRGLTVELDSMVNLARRDGEQKFDVIVSNDTLCYLDGEQQRTFVVDCHAALNPGGMLIMNLPALAAFRGIHDISVGIRQRFTSLAVRELFKDSGFTLIRENYWPFLVSPLIFGVRLWQRIQIRTLSGFEVHSDVSLPASWVNNLLYQVTCCENAWLRRKPWGSSLFIVARSSTSIVDN